VELLKRLFGWVNRQAWLVLTLTTLIWGGNVVAGRSAVGEMSPLSLVSLRWFFAFAMIAVFAREEARRDFPMIGRAWPRLIVMGALGFTTFNALFYIAARYTSGVSLAILQGSTPIFVMAGAALVFAQRFRALQWMGLAVTTFGVVMIATQGDPRNLSTLQFNRGDVYCVIACALFAVYSLGLRNRPPISAMSLFAAMSLAAFASSVPLAIWEIAQGQAMWPTPKGWAILAYIAIGPSFLGQLLWMRGVALIGPARAGLYYNLTPVFGSMLSVLILREAFGWHQGLALALVLGGIALAERKAGS